MSTAISVLGGVGLFLLGMTVMTSGLKGMAGSALRTVLSKAAATPMSGVFWGAVVTLIVQSSSATTMTTIGLVSAGLLTFPEGLGLVFGANIGTTGTGWLVALIGVRVSLTAYALPMIFVGALIKLLGRGRVSAAGAALAGFALVLFGLTVTLSAHYAGAVGLDQACALVIGQNIGTATSSAMAAIGASSTAKRLALAYILFKLVAAVIALILFPVVTPLLVGASSTIDGVTLLAAYHTAYNVIGVLVLLPVIDKFTRFVERLLPERGSPLTRCLDPAALATPIAAVEAVRRTVARAIEAMCGSINAQLQAANQDVTARSAKVDASVAEAADALRQAQVFMSDVSGPPESEDEQRRLTSTLHALDHATRLAEIASDQAALGAVNGGPDDVRAAQLCADAMRSAALVAAEVTVPPATRERAKPIESKGDRPRSLNLPVAAADGALTSLEHCAKTLAELQPTHRIATLSVVGSGALTADEAIARVDVMRRLEALAHHAWRCGAHLVGQGA